MKPGRVGGWRARRFVRKPKIALHAYTRANAWYLNRENDLGSIETGKLADLVVLDKDYFSVSDADMRSIRPILTIIDGDIVHDTGVLG